jgi:sugar (pentulose or hexulose) kinase
LKKPTFTSEVVMVIDAGTQSIRVSAVDLSGNIIDIVKTPIEPYFSTQPGWAEQDPDYYWKTLGKTCKTFLKKTSIPKKNIKGVTITTQRNTIINLDKDGNHLRPAIVWMDRKIAEVESWPRFPMSMAFKAINMLDVIRTTIRESEANWIKQHEPHVWEKTDKLLFLSGYFIYKLTGDFVESTGNQVGYIPFDYKKQTWASKGHMYWKMFATERSMLPSLVKPGEVLGTISAEASKATGIPKGLPLLAAATDKACEVLGSGCLTPNVGCLSYGTTATIETTNSNFVELYPFIPPYPSAVPGMYNSEVQIFRGYWMVSWFKKEFGLREEQIAAKRNIPPEVLFDELIKDIPPGSMGLTLQPYWSPGVKVPGLEAKGAIIGFGDVHTRAHIYRAILEGLAYALKEGTDRTEKRNKVPIERIRVSGGGSQSDIAMQLTADIFDRPAERPHTYETSTLGAAIDAVIGLGLHSSFEDAVDNMTRVKDTFLPDPVNRDLYKDLYENVYLKMYSRLKPLYQDIQEITGYPRLFD